MDNEEEAPLARFRVHVVISSLGNERRTIQLGERTQEEIQALIKMIDGTFGTIRMSNAIMFTDTNGLVTFANLENVAFVEVQVQDA